MSRTAGEITVGDTHYRDAADAATRTWKFDAVPNGEYVAMRFTFGLDSLLNVTGGLPLTNENFNMAWPPDLGGGYHLMMLDGTFWAAPPWSMAGAFGREAAPCGGIRRRLRSSRFPGTAVPHLPSSSHG